MLIQIVTHTPIYVWAILALLVYRGVAAMQNREMGIRKLFIIPLIMLALSLQDISGKFGVAFLPFAAWAAGAAGTMLMVWRFGSARVALGAEPGSVRVPGSWVPLAMMMAIFFTKYVTAVTMAMQPQLAHNLQFLLGVSTWFGIVNGYFLGRLTRDMTSLQALRAQAGAGGPAAIAA